MASLNKWIGIGNLGRDPVMRTFQNGDAVANVSIACTEKWKDKQSGEQKENTEWVSLVFTGKLADIAGQYLRKGSSVYIEGGLRTRKWQDKEGQDHYTTEVRVNQMQMLGGRSEQPSTEPRQSESKPAQTAGFDDMDSDIPF